MTGINQHDIDRISRGGNSLADAKAAGTVAGGPLSHMPADYKEHRETVARYERNAAQAAELMQGLQLGGGVPLSSIFRFFGHVLFWTVGAPILLFFLVVAIGAISTPSHDHVDVAALSALPDPDPAFYKPKDRRVAELAKLPFREIWRVQVAPNWRITRPLNDQEVPAAHAVWLRYLRGGREFQNLDPAGREFVRNAVWGYLTHEARRTGDPRYLSDLARSNLSMGGRHESAVWHRLALQFPDDPVPVAMATKDDAVWYHFDRGVQVLREACLAVLAFVGIEERQVKVLLNF